MIYLDASQPKIIAGLKLMDVVSKTYSEWCH
jgi:hypothetical protein